MRILLEKLYWSFDLLRRGEQHRVASEEWAKFSVTKIHRNEKNFIRKKNFIQAEKQKTDFVSGHCPEESVIFSKICQRKTKVKQTPIEFVTRRKLCKRTRALFYRNHNPFVCNYHVSHWDMQRNNECNSTCLRHLVHRFDQPKQLTEDGDCVTPYTLENAVQWTNFSNETLV